MYIPVHTLGLTYLVFHKGTECGYGEAGSVSQGIGNVLWLKPLAPLPGVVQVTPIPRFVVILAVLANTDGQCRPKLPTGHNAALHNG